MEIDLKKWVESAPKDRMLFRQAVHVILYAISSDEVLRLSMIMKGGMLLGLRYKSKRYTTDIDFSTSKTLDEINKDEFEYKLENALNIASDEMPYQVKCKLQSSKIKPNERATFPGFKIKVGYADTNNPGMIKRLNGNNSPTVINIDYSLNENSDEFEELIIEEGSERIHAYTIIDILAEKYRSIIQQIIRNRERRQDVYDIWYLINYSDEFSIEDKKNIVKRLYKKSEGRIKEGDLINKDTLDREEIIKKSSAQYSLLVDEVDGELPSFEKAYNSVNSFYKSLPWDDS